MNYSHARLLVTSLAVALAACAVGAAGGPAQTRDPLLITLEEISTSAQSNAYELVQALRPAWLRIRGPTTFRPGGDPIMVYLETQRLGTVDQLRNVAAGSIESIRFLDRREASLQFGPGHVNGAIVISMRSR
jgi:hypothetical protein